MSSAHPARRMRCRPSETKESFVEIFPPTRGKKLPTPTAGSRLSYTCGRKRSDTYHAVNQSGGAGVQQSGGQQRSGGRRASVKSTSRGVGVAIHEKRAPPTRPEPCFWKGIDAAEVDATRRTSNSWSSGASSGFPKVAVNGRWRRRTRRRNLENAPARRRGGGTGEADEVCMVPASGRSSVASGELP